MVSTGSFPSGKMSGPQQDALHLYQADAASWADVSADAEVLFRNVTTGGDGGMQSFAVDSVNQNVYIAEPIAEGVQLDDEDTPVSHTDRIAAGDLCFSRMTMSGVYLDRMYVRGVGNALAIAVDPLSDGTVNVWTGTDASDDSGGPGYSTTIGYFPWSPSDTTALDSGDITRFMPDGEPSVWAATAIDPTTRRLLYSHTNTAMDIFDHTLYDLEEAYQGVFEPIATLAMDRGSDLLVQGIAAVGNYLYMWTGYQLDVEPRVSTIMFRYDFTTGRLVESVLVDDLLDDENYPDTHREPEGLAVWLTDADSLASWVLGAGFNSVPPEGGWHPTVIRWPGNTTPANSDPNRQVLPPATSRIDVAAEPDTLLFNALLHDVTGMQSFAFDDVNGHIYAMQITENNVQLYDEAAPVSYADRKAHGDMTISRLDTDGNLQDRMYARGIGYSMQFAVDARPDGTVKLWTGFYASSGGTSGYSQRVGYFDYEPYDDVEKRGILDSVNVDAQFNPTAGYDRWVACNIDPVGRRLIYGFNPSGTTVREHIVYDLDEAYQGIFRPLARVPVDENDPEDAGPTQGFVSYGNYLYVWAGDSLASSPEGYSVIRIYDLTTGERISSTSVTALMGEVEAREPDGLAIRTPDPTNLDNVHLVAGFACSDSDPHTVALIEWKLGPQDSPAPAGEWASLALGEGVTGNGFVRLNGDKVETFGRLSKDSGFTAGDVIATLPEEFRPTSTQDGIYAASNSGVETLGLVRCDIYTDGTITVISQPGQIDVAGTPTATGTGGTYAWISVSGSFYKTSPTATSQ
ncbi:hypothetical protein [Streptomyces fractus]|uniref:phage baseplate protein n=1 Tax=Streptomyces fractus TaxID=641806 RepID=UPI003CF2CB0F